jgi:hypothetical protein
VPTPEAEQLFSNRSRAPGSVTLQELASIRSGRTSLADTNFDVGRALPRGSYPLEDETYDEWFKKLSERKFAGASASLRADLRRHFGADPRVTALSP